MRFSLYSSSFVSLLLLAGTVAFVATAAVAYLSLDEVLARDRTREHARQAQLLIRRAGMLLLDLETGQRGFIITGQVAFLEPYEQARMQFDGTYSALKKLLGDDENLHKLDQLSHRRISQVERNVDRRWAIGEAVLKDLSNFVAGKHLMDEIRAELERLEAQQEARIMQANEGTQAMQQRTLGLAAALPAAGCLLVGGAMLALRHQRRRRDQAEAALQQANMALEMAVSNRTVQLHAALRRIQDFAIELDAGIEAERKQLAREVHDQIGQIGTATKMLVLSLRRELPPGHEASLQELIVLADEGIATARSISAALRPPLLDDFGLGAALEHYAQGLARRSGIEVEVRVAGDERLTPAQANPLFRIVQEACTNVLRHAQASRLQLIGGPLAGGQGYRLEVVDDGRGPGSVRADASGLRNMRERAALLRGHFEFGPAQAAGEGGGTRVAVELPFEEQQKDTEAQPA